MDRWQREYGSTWSLMQVLDKTTTLLVVIWPGLGLEGLSLMEMVC